MKTVLIVILFLSSSCSINSQINDQKTIIEDAKIQIDTTHMKLRECYRFQDVMIISKLATWNRTVQRYSDYFINDSIFTRISDRSDMKSKTFHFSTDALELTFVCVDSIPLLTLFSLKEKATGHETSWYFNPCNGFLCSQIEEDVSTGISRYTSYNCGENKRNVMVEYQTVNGKKQGKETWYFSNGNIDRQYFYNAKGNYEGLQYVYYYDGVINSISSYSDGLLNGKRYYYQSNGQLKFVKEYVMGVKK
jgi:hypothetical protein